MRSTGHLFRALRQLPEAGPVGRFDATVDRFFEDHLRGHRAWDRAMYAASAAGEHSLLWLALSAWAGWRTGRPGSTLARAGLALGAESLMVNGLVKAVFRRDRPGPGAEHPYHLRRPLTSSFPSGHASSAFFAAALLRGTPGWPIYYPLAALVAASRAHVRVHHASDVLAGAALGTVLGEAARHALPLGGENGKTRQRAI